MIASKLRPKGALIYLLPSTFYLLRLIYLLPSTIYLLRPEGAHV
jgi:hypothetical protein